MLAEGPAVRRLLDRLGFGARHDEVAAARERGFDATLAALLAPAPADPGAAATPPPDLPYVDVSSPGLSEVAKGDGYERRARQQRQLLIWWLDRMVRTRAPLTERLTWFWHGHFATSAEVVNDPRLMLRQNETFRRLGAGPFGDLARALVVDPALLLWLNGDQNKAGAPNEDLAREFLELFTLGVGHYAEADVREAARALTGWTVDAATGTASLDPARHDAGPKTVLGTTGTLGAESLATLLAGTPDAARFVATRLAFRCLSATPPRDATMAALLEAHDGEGDVRGVVGALARSDAFREAGNALVKQPVEWVVGLLRALDVSLAALPDATASGVLDGLNKLGQVPFRPPNVGGWPAGRAWLTPSAGLHRYRLAAGVVVPAALPPAPVSAPARVEWAGQVLSVDAWSARTASALAVVADDPVQLIAMAAASPEYVVSA